MEEAAPRTDIVVANELDEYSSSFGYRTVRLGLGTGPNIHRVTRLRGIDLQSGTIGIPNVGEKTIGDDQFLVALCARSPGGTRWSELDFSTGTMLVLGPGSDATWVNRDGTMVQIAHVDSAAASAMAERLGFGIRLPEPGVISHMPLTPHVRTVRALLASLGHPLDDSSVPQANSTDHLAAVVRAVAEPCRRTARGRRLDSRRLVRTCVDFAESTGARPSIPELCAATNVSERRLRQAFHDSFDMAPLAYFRFRSLTQARELLLGSQPRSVTDVSLSVGWGNVGRFAEQYRKVFEESPSQTLATTPRRALS